MKFILATLLALSLLFAAGCGRRCTIAETTICAAQLSSCQGSCASDAVCLSGCTTSYCDCLDEAGCDKTGSCK